MRAQQLERQYQAEHINEFDVILLKSNQHLCSVLKHVIRVHKSGLVQFDISVHRIFCMCGFCTKQVQTHTCILVREFDLGGDGYPSQ